MASTKSTVLAIVLPVTAVVLAITITTAILIHRHLRQRTLLPTAHRAPTPLFTPAHISSIRPHPTPNPAPTTPTENPWPKLKSDPNHIPFLATPLPSHQPVKGNWQKFKEKQALRKEQAQMPHGMAEKWGHQPKTPAYWREFGKNRRKEMGWWGRAKEDWGW